VADRARGATDGTASPRLYRSEIRIRFSHCDPAGIVFFPRYLEMFNDIVEDWCRDELNVSFAEIHGGRGWGVPTVHLDVDFIAPSVIGDVLSATLAVRSLGSTSFGLNIVLQGPDGADRVRGHAVLVLVDPKSLRPTPIPDEMRARMAAFYASA